MTEADRPVRLDRLERDLTAWLDDTAMPSVPEYVNDVVREATRHRQRPRWSFLERWWPAWIARPVVPRSTRVAVSVLLLLLALVLVLVAVAVVGTQRALPPPFGPADNGLMAFERDGDIYTFDPVNGIERAIVTGEGRDHDPRWSSDGQRIVFVRETAQNDHLVVVDGDGNHPVVSESEFYSLDTDTIAWSPNGRQVAFAADDGVRRAIYILDAVDGQVHALEPDFLGADLSWRPPDGKQLLFVGSLGSGGALRLVSVVDGAVENVPASAVDPNNVRGLGWTPEGRYLAFQGSRVSGPYETVLLDMETGLETPIDATFGHISNDGSMIAGFSTVTEGPQLCVRPIDGDTCVHIGRTAQAPEYSTTAGIQWSPDDRWITTFEEESRTVWLLSRDGTVSMQIEADGPASWQRTEVRTFALP